jgi:hypothetical protein
MESKINWVFILRYYYINWNRICGLVVRVLGYRSEDRVRFPAQPNFLKKKKTVVGLELGPLSLVSTTEELLNRKVAALV